MTPAQAAARLRALPSLRQTRRWRTDPQIPQWAIVAAAALACAVFAHYLGGTHKKYAAAIVFAAVYAPIAFFNLPWALALWVGVLFIQDLRVLGSGPNAMGVLLALGSLVAVLAGSRQLRVLRGQKAVLVTAMLLATWLTVSAAWAQSPSTAGTMAGHYWLCVLVMVIVITTVTTTRAGATVTNAFVIGGVMAAVVGLVGSALIGVSAGQADLQGRLTGGGGDPNVQAAAFVGSIFIVTGLMAVARRRAARLLLGGAFVLITVAFFETESRGGLIALLVAAAAAVVISPTQRKRLLQLVAVAGVVAAVVAAASPGALTRITDFSGGSSGRNDIWAVAILIFEHHPVVGVGANNFSIVEPSYALDIRNATRVQYIAEQPRLFPAHNSYLQMLADVGIIGLVLYLAAIFACLRAGWLAARLFDKKGHAAHAQLARSCLTGAIGFLTANFFITDGGDWRLWALLGLGPAMLTLARGASPRKAVAEPRRAAVRLVRSSLAGIRT